MTLSTEKRKRMLKVRLAENQLEIERTLSLRYDIFNVELGEGLPRSAATRKDRDEYDLYCDHLIVVDEAHEKRIVGTYRILRSSVARRHIGFYSSNEFDLSELEGFDQEAAEIGRSCVHPDYRDGSVITLLWQGLCAYMRDHNVRYLMGCGSVHSTDGPSASLAYAYFKQSGAMADWFTAKPLPGMEVPDFDRTLFLPDVKSVSREIPALMKGYIRAGARIAGEPALDREFGTTDYFIIFDQKVVDAKYGKHFGV